MRKSSAFALGAAVFTAIAAAPAGAATLTASGALGVTIAGLSPVTIAGGPTAIFVSSGGGSFVEPVSMFGPASTALPTQLFTGVDLISSLNVTVANGTKTVTSTGGIGGGMGGPGGLIGSAIVGVLGGLINLGIPLANVGAGGVVQAGAAALMITVTGHIWTTGAAAITGVTSETNLGGFTNTVTNTGFDNRTATSHKGTILLISPFRAITNAAGTLTGFATQLLTFVPEPGTLLLIGSGFAGIAFIGRKKLKK